MVVINGILNLELQGAELENVFVDDSTRKWYYTPEKNLIDKEPLYLNFTQRSLCLTDVTVPFGFFVIGMLCRMHFYQLFFLSVWNNFNFFFDF